MVEKKVDKKKVLKLRAEGKTYREIGEKLGVSPVRIYQIVKERKGLAERLKSIEKRVEQLETKRSNIPTLSEFQNVIYNEEYTRLIVDSLNAVRIPELRRAIKFRLGIDDDTFEELLIRLSEADRCRLKEGTGDGGIIFRGKNYMFVKM